MKARIGKPPSRLISNIYRNHVDRKYGYLDYPEDKDRDRTDRFVEKLDDYLQNFYNIFNRVWFDHQERTPKVKIDPWDTWSMDYTLKPIILPMLKQLKETKHGAPFVDYEDAPEHLRPTQEEIDAAKQGDTDEHWFQRWDWAMDEMIFAFESIESDWEEQFMSGDTELIAVPVNWNGEEVADEDADLIRYDHGPNHTRSYDFEGMKVYQDRISNGFRLFGKYFQSLWD